MQPIETNDYILRLMDKNNPDELYQVQKLRYDHLLREFDPNLPEEGLDDDGFDEYCDSLVVIYKPTGKIIGTYRLATMATSKGHPFKLEEEFDITAMKEDPDGIIETGRAVIHVDHRNGGAIGLIWRGIFEYGKYSNCRYSIGTVSFHGVDPSVHKKALSYIGQFKVNDKFHIRSIKNSFEYEHVDGVTLANCDMPGLVKGYIALGATFSENGFIDYEFKSCDVFLIIDLHNVDPRLLKFLTRF